MAEITSDAVIGFAKQGHPQAIAVLLNRALVPRGAHVKVRQKKELLKVLINFLRATEIDHLVSQVQETFNDLSPENVQRVQIFTQRLGDRQASFQKEIVTANVTTPTPPPPDESNLDLEQLDLAVESSEATNTSVSPMGAPVEAEVSPAPTELESLSSQRYSVAEFLSQISSVEELNVLEDHPFFTGVCPQCAHGFVHLNTPPLFWDCSECGWRDDLSQKIPRHQLRETPQRLKISQGKRLGSYLVEAGLLTPAQIEVALADQQLAGVRLGEVLVRRGWIKEETVEYFMRKVVEPERQATSGKAEAYLESSRNLLKTLIHQSKSNPSEVEPIDQASIEQDKPTVVEDELVQPNRSVDQAPAGDQSSPINTRKTLILSESNIPPTTAVNERETLLLPDLDRQQLLDEQDL